MHVPACWKQVTIPWESYRLSILVVKDKLTTFRMMRKAISSDIKNNGLTPDPSSIKIAISFPSAISPGFVVMAIKSKERKKVRRN